MIKDAKKKYAHICKITICINMHKICTNMQNQACINMHFQNMHKCVFYMDKYALYAVMCIWINMPLYANSKMHKYA